MAGWNKYLQNEGELSWRKNSLNRKRPICHRLLYFALCRTGLPAARELLPKALRISTIDSFQGQEKKSLFYHWRSNEDGEIGFWKITAEWMWPSTRAKEKLFVIGDSATIGHDAFMFPSWNTSKSMAYIVHDLGIWITTGLQTTDNICLLKRESSFV